MDTTSVLDVAAIKDFFSDITIRQGIVISVIGGLILAIIIGVCNWIWKKIFGKNEKSKDGIGQGTTPISYNCDSNWSTAPPSANRDLYVEALKKSDSGDYDGAINDFKSILYEEEDNSKRAAVELQIGNAYCKLYKYRKAQEHYTNSIRIARNTGNKKAEASALGAQANAYIEMPTNAGFLIENCITAIDKYLQALEIFTSSQYPAEYAGTQNNLGAAYTHLAMWNSAEGAENLRKAIECYKKALDVYRKDEYPVGFAMTQNNLGVVYRKFPPQDNTVRAKNLRKSIDCHIKALDVYTKDEYPQNYCKTTACMGMSMAEIDPVRACYYLREAYSLREFLPDKGKEFEELMEKVCKE